MAHAQLDPSMLQAMKFRCIGPPRGGRVLAVAGHPTAQMTFYFGGCAGGIWKTEDGGTYWHNISDGFLKSSAVGALAVAQSDPNVIYAGMGESTIRIDVSHGDGVYKSTDGGKTWVNKGLPDSRHIGEIRIHPQNAELVYVAVLGHGFGENAERGVYRSQDGGDSWELVLHKSEKAGAVDLAMDVTNPRILFASIYETKRTFWDLSSGGPDSGLWKSTDSGDSWQDISNNKGLPEGIKGKIGVAVSPANPNRVWAIIEAKEKKAGLYRSENGGDSWEQVSDNRDLIHRPWYYCHVFADPQDADTVYITNLKMWKSTDGGKNFVEITTPHGDNHDLWIDPTNPQRMIEGNDGGACVSFNGGQSWSTIYNQKTAQFYHVAVDSRTPYHVYGTQQDNSSLAVPSGSEKGGIPWADCYPAGTGESGYIAVHPEDPNIVYVGAIGSSPGGGNSLQRYDHRTKQIRLITTWPEAYTGYGAESMKYRFAWTYPIAFSHHDTNVLFIGGNHIFRTTNEGQSWDIISPDLSRQAPETLLPPGGPITLDTSGAETYGTVYAFAECPTERGTLWAGSDDGLVHLSRDGGETWNNVTPANLPDWALISMITPSPHAAGTVYMAATRYKLDDYAPYLFKTADYGASWTLLDSFPTSEITRCVREDPKAQGLLYVGTETGIFYSLDGGTSWARLQNNLPVVPVYDLVIKDDDLVVGTHGRSFWILDDLTPLRTLALSETAATVAPDAAPSNAILFAPRTTVRQWQGWFVNAFRGPGKNYMMSLGASLTFTEEVDEYGEKQRDMLDAGENPPFGVIVYYALPEGLSEDLKLTILDAGGNEIRSYGPKPEPVAEDEPDKSMPAKKQPNAKSGPYLSTKPGLNRFVWDMYYPDGVKPEGDPAMDGVVTGPLAAPGTFQVRLQAGDTTQTESFEIMANPTVDVTQEELDAQFALNKQICDKLSETHQGINRLRRIRTQVQNVQSRMEIIDDAGDAAVSRASTDLATKLDAIEAALIQTGSTGARDRLRLPARLNTKLATLLSVVGSCDAAPTAQSYDVYNHLSSQIDEQLELLDGLLGDDIAAFNDLVQQSEVPAIVV